jgi:nucleoredoxin
MRRGSHGVFNISSRWFAKQWFGGVLLTVTVNTQMTMPTELFAGKKLLNKQGVEVSPSSSLRNKVVGLFFSAGWCPPCRRFLPVLVDFYQSLVGRGAPLEIVFISSDATVEDMTEYMQQHGNWLTLPHSDSNYAKQLKRKYSIQTIPKFVVVKPDGTVISIKGRKEVTEIGEACFDNWLKSCGGVFEREAPDSRA